MENLAGRKDCDPIIQEELRLAKIRYVQVERTRSEVPYTYEGRIGYSIRLWRAWYYWVAEGNVPLEVAEEIEQDPVCKDIRVAGHCGCPPAREWARWYLPNGRKVLDMEQKEECLGFIKSGSSLADSAQRILDSYDFHDDPGSIGAKQYIEVYHIDSQLGLRVYRDAVAKIYNS